MAKKDVETALTIVDARQAPETSQPAANAVRIGDTVFQAVQQVNVPVLSQEDGETVVFRIDKPIREEVNYREVPGVVDGVKTMITQENIINVVRVLEAYSRSPFDYVCNAMTAGNIKATYPEHSYVGRWFAVTKNGLVPGKNYKHTSVMEIEPVEAPELVTG